MIAISRKKKTAVFRSYVAAETAVPCVVCSACLKSSDVDDFFFAGVVRSKSVRSPDDGIGPNTDEFFTVSIGGMATLLNTSGGPLFPGDLIAWDFVVDAMSASGGKAHDRAKNGPRRIVVKQASVSSSRIIGRSLSFSKPGESFDLLIKQ